MIRPTVLSIGTRALSTRPDVGASVRLATLDRRVRALAPARAWPYFPAIAPAF